MEREGDIQYEGLITSSDWDSETDSFIIKTDKQTNPLFRAHGLFFSIDPNQITGKIAAIYTNSQGEIQQIFLSAPYLGAVYKFDAAQLQEYENVCTASMNDLFATLQDEKGSKASQRWVDKEIKKQQKILHKRQDIECDIKMQKKYEKIKYGIDVDLRPMLGIDELPNYYSLEDMVHISFAQQYTKLVEEMKDLQSYLTLRHSEVDEVREKILKKRYDEYFRLGKYLDYPMRFEIFIKNIHKILNGEPINLYK